MSDNLNRKGKLLSSIMFDLNKSTAFMCVGIDQGGEADRLATARWSQSEDDEDLVLCLAYLFREPWFTDDILQRALSAYKDLREADERTEDTDF
tara:strand:+ start:2025 stop:2306 length:282 start_codon:yes stop_codon:yes gene_type:complete